MSAELPRTGLMNPPETDALEQLRKIVEPPKPKTLNAQIEALSDKQREQLNLFVSQLKLSMAFSRANDRYADYKTLIRRMYPKLNMEFSELITDVMESLDPTPEMPPEVRYKRSLERKRTPREMAMNVYDNPKYFPPRDAMKTEQVYRAPVSNNGGPNPRASIGGRDTAQQIEAPSATISSEETLFDFGTTALLGFINTTEGRDAANKTLRNKLEQSESSGRSDAEITLDDGRKYVGLMAMGEARLEDYKRATNTSFTQEQFKNNPELQDKVGDWHLADIDKNIDAMGEDSKGYNRDGLRAVAHLGGLGGMKKYVQSKGKYNPSDQLGTSLSDYYDKFSGDV
ncbi:hypothetical protein N9S42_00575 [Paracoccaceae bacterium]|jgi:hypothetical protein|nr:hypothetical protein [Paracoccaceae bacterium]